MVLDHLRSGRGIQRFAGVGGCVVVPAALCLLAKAAGLTQSVRKRAEAHAGIVGRLVRLGPAGGARLGTGEATLYTLSPAHIVASQVAAATPTQTAAT